MSAIAERVWISRRRAAALLAVSSDALDRLIEQRLVTTRCVPGCRPRVLLDDVERLARESTVPADGPGGDHGPL